jgi:Tfp pilus assembly PilM family ATPase
MADLTRAEARSQYAAKRRVATETAPPVDEVLDISPATINCIKCQKENPGAHRFCRGCGTALWRACTGCGDERPVDEAFCALCGTNLAELENKRVREFATELADVDQLASSHRYAEAISRLRTLLAKDRIPCLDDLRKAATATLDRVTAQRDEMRTRLAGHVATTRQLLEQRKYEEALREISQVSASVRNEEAEELFAVARRKAEEIASLKERLRAATGVTFEERMGSLSELLELMPDDPQVQRWATQARDQIVQLAKKKLSQHQYRQAVGLLECVPAAVVDTSVEELKRTVAELDYLWSEIEWAPAITETVLRMGQRLTKLAPQNAQAQEKFREMTRRYQTNREKSNAGTIAWAESPAESRVGLPVNTLSQRKALRSADGSRGAMESQPERFCVATGLALQSVGQCQVTTNLMPNRSGGVLGLLRSPLLERPAKSGWGIDLSASGLKAIRIAIDTDGMPIVKESVDLPHRLSLTHPEAAGIRKALLIETLKKFVAQHEVGSADRVTIGWPAVQLFARFLRLPPAEGKKGRDMLELESRQQIPMPLDQVTRDTFTFVATENASRFEPRLTLLLAVRASDIDEHLSLFKQAEVPVHAIQCDAVALHNWFHFLFADEMPDETGESSAQGYVLLDVGAETTNVVFSFRNALWFRGVRPGGDELLPPISRRFKITREAAEELVRNPAKARRVSEVHEEACQVYLRLATQIEACLSECARSSSLGKMREIVVVGGASQAPGLVRFLRHGR